MKGVNSTLLPTVPVKREETKERRAPQFEEEKKLTSDKYKEKAVLKKMVKRDMKAAKLRIQKAYDVDVVIILDCTGSMDSYIKEA